MQRRYFHDSRFNYMIVPCPQGREREGYRYRMLASNTIEGLLPCSFRQIDGQEYLYYEITSRQSLESLFSSRPIDGGQMRLLLHSLCDAVEEMKKYLLDASGLVLDPGWVFYDFRKKVYLFVYYPGESATPEEGGREAAEAAGETEETAEANGTQESDEEGGFYRFLVSHVDEEDQEAAALAYRALALSTQPDFLPGRELFEEETEPQQSQSSAQPQSSPQPAQEQASISPAPQERQGERAEEVPEEVPHVGETSRSAETSPAPIVWSAPSDAPAAGSAEALPQEAPGEQRPPRRARGPVLLALGGFAEAASLLALSWMIAFDAQELLLVRAGIVLGVGVGVVCLVISRRGRREQRRAGEEARALATAPAGGMPPGEEKPLQEREESSPTMNLQEQQVPHLHGEGAARGVEIGLDALPLSIGTLRGFADVVLGDQSVSRMHCRIEEREGRVVLVDLNSTNGTWVNGRRLDPSGEVTLQEGDEITLGRSVFTYS